MARRLESHGVPRLPPARVEAAGARLPTPSAAGTPRDRCAAATPLPRAARPVRFGAVALAALAVLGCRPYVEGNCVNGSRTVTLTQGFEGVRVQTGLQANVTAGAAQPKLVISGDQNLLDYVHYAVEPDPGNVPASVLRLWMEVPGGDFGVCIPPAVAVDAGVLTFVGAEGDSHVAASGLAAQTLAVDASGLSDVTVAGTGGGRLQVTADHAFVHAASYPVSDGAAVTLTSSALAEVHADGPVTGSVAAGCTLTNNGAGTCAGVVSDGKVTCPVQ